MAFAWKKIGSSKGELPSYPPMWKLEIVGDELIGLGTAGNVRVFRDGVFEEVIREDEHGGGLQLYAVAWNGKLHGFSCDGHVVALETGKKWSWRKVAGVAKFPGSWPRGAFDPLRGIFVVWGPATSKGVKDETWVFDGEAWSKIKKAKTPMADVLSDPDGLPSGAFSLVYDPRLECVVRVGTKEVSIFDGKSWRGVPLEHGDAIGDWERTMWADPKTKSIVSAQRFSGEAKLVKIHIERDRARATLLTRMPKVHARKGTDSGGNVQYDLSVFDDARRVLIVFDEQKGQRFEADLTSLL